VKISSVYSSVNLRSVCSAYIFAKVYTRVAVLEATSSRKGFQFLSVNGALLIGLVKSEINKGDVFDARSDGLADDVESPYPGDLRAAA
jgi:hypothetical protein